MSDNEKSDIEDDPVEVSAAEKHTWFQEDVFHLFKRSLKDSNVFSYIIGELDQIRQAHSQKPAALNKEVVRTLIHLPFSVNSAINGDLEEYVSIFEGLLEKYNPLLRNLNKNKVAQLTDVDHVTTPFLELIRSKKLIAADWSTNEVMPVLNALKNHYIIEEVRIKEAMEVIKQGIMEILQQRHMEMDVFKQELTEKKMDEIAKRIFPDHLDELAIELNICHSELQQIVKDNPNNSHRQSFLVLYTWYSRLPPPKANAIVRLEAALRATSNGDAADILMMTFVRDSDAASVSVSTSMPAVVPADSQQDPEDLKVELVGVLKPQPDKEDNTLLERERHRQQPSLTSERFSGKFDHKGGTLDTYLTDDYLLIPPGAIPEGTVYSIWGSVHSALDKFDAWVRKDKGERLIAPVNEICVEGNKRFLIPVTLVIHHAVTEPELLAKVEIILLEDDGSEVEVKPAHKRAEGKPWFEINSECIKIYTLQLCKILCKVDSGNEIEGTLRGILYGQMYEKGRKYIGEDEFYLQFGCSVQSLQGQIENFRSWRTDSGCAYLDIHDFATSPDRLNSDDDVILWERLIARQRNVQRSEMEQQQEAEQRCLMSLATDSDAASVAVPASTPSVVPEETQQGPKDMEVKLVGVLKPQQVKEDCPMLELEIHKQQPPLTSERLRGDLDCEGGTLDTFVNNNHLLIPAEAIPEGTLNSILGVNEVCCENNNGILRPVNLVIHHALSNQELLDKVKIKLKEDDGRELEVKPAHERVDGEPWFEIDPELVEIDTLRLCKPVCKVDCGSKIDGTLRGILYGHMYEKGGKYIGEVEFYLQYCGNVPFNLRGQSKDYRYWRTDSGCDYLDMQTFATSTDQLESNDKLVLEFVFSEEDAEKWALRKGSNESEKILLKSIISCLDKIDDPISITKYAFNSTTIPVTFPLVAMLKVKIVPELPKDNYGFSLEIKMPRAFGRQYNEEGAQAQAQGPASATKRELTENKMMAIAEEIYPNSLNQLAIKLNIKNVKVEHIKSDNPNNSVLQNFLVLQWWHSQLPPPKVNSIAQLEKALRLTNNGDAADVLISNDGY